MERRPAMKKTSTVRVNGNMIFKGHKLTIGLDLGNRWSFYCVLDEAGQVILEQKLPTTPEAMKQTFGKIPRTFIALETGTHSTWVSRLSLTNECGWKDGDRGGLAESEQTHGKKKAKVCLDIS